jgi:hypothetical protein
MLSPNASRCKLFANRSMPISAFTYTGSFTGAFLATGAPAAAGDVPAAMTTSTRAFDAQACTCRRRRAASTNTQTHNTQNFCTTSHGEQEQQRHNDARKPHNCYKASTGKCESTYDDGKREADATNHVHKCVPDALSRRSCAMALPHSLINS